MGVEMLEAVLMDRSTQGGLESVDFGAVNRTPEMILLVTIEELLEMLSVALALRALLIHLVQELGVRLLGAEVVVGTGAASRSGRKNPEASAETRDGAAGLNAAAR